MAGVNGNRKAITHLTSPTHHFAYGALDEQGRAYIVIEPRQGSDVRLKRTAVPVVDLETALHHAQEFNAGRTWAFRTTALLAGSEIPALRRSFADWRVWEVPYGNGDEAFAQDVIARHHLALTERTGAIPPNYALFSRSVEFRVTQLLLSPEAAKWAAVFPGEWRAAGDDVGSHGWSLSYGDAAAHEKLGLERPRRAA